MFFRSKKENGNGSAQHPAPLSKPSAATIPVVPSQTSRSTSTTPTAVSAPTAAKPKPLAPEELKKHAEVSQRLATTVGEIVGLMVRSPRHRDSKLSDLRWLVLPAIRTGQYALISTQSRSHGYTAPVAAVLWASTSAEVDKRLCEQLDTPIRLGPREWRSGDILWLVEAIGDDRAIAALVQRLKANEWKGKPVKARVSDGKGQVKVRLIETQSAPDGSPARGK